MLPAVVSPETAFQAAPILTPLPGVVHTERLDLLRRVALHLGEELDGVME
jgi:hypothetical protein